MSVDLIDIPLDILEKWKALQTENSRQAMEYYFENILCVVAEKFSQENCIKEDCDVLVSLMGFSPATTVLTASAVRPKRLIVVTGKDTLGNYDLAVDFLRINKTLNYHQITLEEIDVHNTVDIYNFVYKVVSNIAQENSSANIIVDITGGKKIMSASAAQAAWEIDASLCYIDGLYDPGLGAPKPGSEHLEILKNPSHEKARQAREKALYAWEMRQFSSAKDLFVKSRNLHTKHELEEIAIPLCDLFDSLYNFDLPEFRRYFDELLQVSQRNYLRDTVYNCKVKQLLEVFQGDTAIQIPLNRIAVFLSLSNSYSELRRYDFAALLSYRALEAIVDYGLKDLAGSDFNRSQPDYTKLLEDIKVLKERYIALRKEINKNDHAMELPHKIGLMDGLLFLALFQPELLEAIYAEPSQQPQIPKAPDSIAKKKSLGSIVNKIRGISDLRNQSILAHGDKSLNKEKFDQLYELAYGLGRSIIGANLEHTIANMTPPKLE